MQGIRYFGTDVLVQPGDIIKMKRWFRMVDGAVVYVPNISPPNKSFGLTDVGIKTYDRRIYYVYFSDNGELTKAVSFQARGKGFTLELPDDIDEL